jgi:hypothetical protein
MPMQTTTLHNIPSQGPSSFNRNTARIMFCNGLCLFVNGIIGAYSISHQFSQYHDFSFEHLTMAHGNMVYPFQITLWDLWLGIFFLMSSLIFIAYAYHCKKNGQKVRKFSKLWIRTFAVLPILVMFVYWSALSASIASHDTLYLVNTLNLHLVAPLLVLVSVYFTDKYLHSNGLIKAEEPLIVSQKESFLYFKWLFHTPEGRKIAGNVFAFSITFLCLSYIYQNVTGLPVYDVMNWDNPISVWAHFFAVVVFSFILLYLLTHENRVSTGCKLIIFTGIPTLITLSISEWLVNHIQSTFMTSHTMIIEYGPATLVAIGFFVSLWFFHYRHRYAELTKDIQGNGALTKEKTPYGFDDICKYPIRSK